MSLVVNSIIYLCQSICPVTLTVDSLPFGDLVFDHSIGLLYLFLRSWGLWLLVNQPNVVFLQKKQQSAFEFSSIITL